MCSFMISRTSSAANEMKAFNAVLRLLNPNADRVYTRLTLQIVRLTCFVKATIDLSFCFKRVEKEENIQRLVITFSLRLLFIRPRQFRHRIDVRFDGSVVCKSSGRFGNRTKPVLIAHRIYHPFLVSDRRYTYNVSYKVYTAVLYGTSPCPCTARPWQRENRNVFTIDQCNMIYQKSTTMHDQRRFRPCDKT